MKKAVCFTAVAAILVGCGDASIDTDERGVPRERGFWPSLVEERQANANGENLSADEARQRLDEFDVSSDDTSRQWPVDTLTYKRFQDPAVRSTFLRRALGRYALIEAKERGLGTSLSNVRRAADVTASASGGEWWSRSVHGADLLAGQRGRTVSLPETVHATIKPAGAERAITDEDEVEFGVRSRLLTGGEISVSQRFTTTDSNRVTYIPGEQTSSRTSISLVQPILRGSGISHNDSPRRIANMDTQIAIEEFRRQAESHLLEVERAYWNLYVARAVYVQTTHLAGHGSRLASQISGRSGIDADTVLVTRARSLAEQWQADRVRAKAALDNAEYRIAALVGDKRFGPANIEIVPSSAPNGSLAILKTKDTVEDIFTNRPELQQAILQYQAALLREGMAANDSLPELDLILEVSADGGSDGRDLSGAFSDQSNGNGHLIGLKFSVPLGFDERDARYKRRRLETIQQERQVLSVIQTILLEVDVSANEYIVACNDLIAQRKSLAAAQSSLRTVANLWNEGGASEGGIGLLSALLSSYEQVQASEQAVATARATREIAAANLARARGVLLDRWGLKTDIVADIRDQPTYQLRRQ